MVLDDAVVHHRDRAGLVGVGVADGGAAVGRPAGVADAGVAADRVLDQEVGEGDELAYGAAAREVAVLQRGDAGAVVAAVLQPLQRLEDERGHLVVAQDRDDAAHQRFAPSAFSARRRSIISRPERGFHRLPAAARGRARPSGTSAVITEPAATRRARRC